MSDYEPVKGDRVRVVIEGEVLSQDGGGPRLVVSAKYGREHTVWYGRDGVTVEKMEPPVERFGPGDTVRSKETGAKVLLAAEGFVNLRSLRFHRYGQVDLSVEGNGGRFLDRDQFTSETHEKVDL